MKNLFLCIVCSFAFNGFGQEFKSLELLKTSMEKFKPIGENNGFLYYYVPNRGAGGLKIEIYKIKESTFELVDRKIVDVEITGRKAFLNEDNVAMKAYFKNNKFYFFYCMANSGDFYVYLTTIDETLSNLKTTELGVMVETGYEKLGFFYVDLSPDFKSAIVTLKNKCERKKAVGTNTNVIYENTELVYVDLINEKIIYSKRLPIEMDEMRFKTQNYVTDNEGNITFVAMIAKRKKDSFMNTINGIGIGKLDGKDEKMKLTEIDTKGSTTVNYQIIKNKQDDVIHIEKLDNSLTYKKHHLDNLKQISEYKIAIEKSYDLSFNTTNNGYLIEDEKNYILLNEKLEILWKLNQKNFFNVEQASLRLLYDGQDENFIYSFKNKIYFIWNEAKSYELTEKNKKILANKYKFYPQYGPDLKTENTVLCSVDENGNQTKKRIINDNMNFEFRFLKEDYVSDAGNLYTEVWDSKKRILFLKQIPLK